MTMSQIPDVNRELAEARSMHALFAAAKQEVEAGPTAPAQWDDRLEGSPKRARAATSGSSWRSRAGRTASEASG